MPDGTKPLPEPMLSKFIMPYDVTRPQWVKVWIHWPLQGVAVVLKIIFPENISLATCEIAFSWKPQNLTHVKSTLILVKAWCHQATSHYLSQCWSRSLLPYGITRLQWVNTLRLRQNGCHSADIFKHILLLHTLNFQQVRYSLYGSALHCS